MKIFHFLSVIILLSLSHLSCKKADESIGSPDTKKMCGTHNYHFVGSGYNPLLQKNVTDSSDTSATIVFVNSGTVNFSNFTFVYDSTNAQGILYFHYKSSLPYSSDAGRINYNSVSNTVFIYENLHVSAGAGNWQYTYTSF